MHTFTEYPYRIGKHHIHNRMKKHDVARPSVRDIVVSLKSCAKVKDLKRGFQIHVEIVRLGLLERNAFIGSALVDMYCKYGSLVNAQNVFDELPVQDVVSWTTLISGYVEHNYPDRALEVFEQMKCEGVIPNGFTFVCVLKACGVIGATNKVFEMHSEIAHQRMVETDIVVGNTLVDVYAKCDCVVNMKQAFNEIPIKDVVSWTTLISGYLEHGYGEEALRCLEFMQSEGVTPNALTYVCGLKACGSVGARNNGEAIHAEIQGKGFETNIFIQSALIDMYIHVGFFEKAKEIFDDMKIQDVVAWTSLIGGYVNHGDSINALKCFHQMQMEGTPPNIASFICCLKASGCTGSIDRGQEIQSVIETFGSLESNVVLLNALLDMYVKCDSFSKAEEVFDRFHVRDVVSWNVLIAGYVNHGYHDEVFKCVNWMQHEGVFPSAVTLMYIVKTCTDVGVTWKGMQVHAEIENLNFLEIDISIGSSLIDMYAKSGSLDLAKEVFDKLPVRDAVSWTALIAGFVQHGLNKEAITHLDYMQLEGVFPNMVTFTFSLKACSCVVDIHKAQEIHAEIARKGLLLEGDLGVGNALVETYAACGFLSIAQEVFDHLPFRSSVEWAVIITHYVEHGYYKEVSACMEMMRIEGIVPDPNVFISGLRTCGCIGAIEMGQSLHSEMEKLQLPWQGNQLVGNALLGMYGKCGFLEEAQQVFENIRGCDVVSWNALIVGYIDSGHSDKALKCFDHMQLMGISPDIVTYICSLKACSSIAALDKGNKIQAEIERWGGSMKTDPFVGSILVDMHVKCGSLAKAQNVFDNLPVKNIVSWNALMIGYSNHGHSETALKFLEQLQLRGILPNCTTYICCLRACASTGAIDKGQYIHAEIQRQGLLEGDSIIGSALVDMYVKCSLLADAEKMFDKLPFRDVVSWTALIGGYARLGKTETIFPVFERMLREGIKPDVVISTVVLNACSRTGFFGKSQTYFEAMSRDYDIVPTIEHHICMVDTLGRLGQLDKAVGMVSRMPFFPDLATWGIILCACKHSGNVQLGKEAFQHAIHLNENDPAAYVLISQIYADTEADV